MSDKKLEIEGPIYCFRCRKEIDQNEHFSMFPRKEDIFCCEMCTEIYEKLVLEAYEKFISF